MEPSNTLSIIAVVISFFSLLITYSLLRISTRPYVTAESFASLEPDSTYALHNNIVIIKTIQSPAKVLTETYTYIIYSENHGEKILNCLTINDSIFMPSDAAQYIRTTEININDIVSKLSSSEELRRIVDIKYKGLNHIKKYEYRGIWKYNVNTNVWDVIECIAD